MEKILCPYCDSTDIEPVELSVVKCIVCGNYFDLDDSPRVEKIKHKPSKFDEDQ